MAYNSAKYNTYQNQNIDPIPNTKLLRCINICQTIFFNETRSIKEKSDLSAGTLMLPNLKYLDVLMYMYQYTRYI